MYQLIHGSAHNIPIPDKSVHTICTSPPYFSLRQYSGDQAVEWPAVEYAPMPGLAPIRVPAQTCELGLENEIESYIGHLMLCLREWWRVLRDDGTCWLNLSDSMSSGKGANLLNSFNSILKDAVVCFFHPPSAASPTQSIDIATGDELSPDGKLISLLASQWNGIKDGDQNFGQVLHLFAAPSNRWGGSSVLRQVTDRTYFEVGSNCVDYIRVIGPDLDTQPQSVLGILRATSARTAVDDKASFSVNEANEPSIRNLVVWHTGWDSFAANAFGERVPYINAMDKPIAFRDGLDTFACPVGNFRITEASEKEITFCGISGAFEFRITDVRHLWFSFQDGSLVPYATLYNKASQMARSVGAKQEMSVPERFKLAAQADGWICRSTIIWSKPNPMPESVTDRPTKAHEYVYLLAKAERYYYDADAIREPYAKTWNPETNGKVGPDKAAGSWWANGGTRDIRGTPAPVKGGGK